MRIILQRVTPNYPAPALSYLLGRLSSFQRKKFPSTEKFQKTCEKYAGLTIPMVSAEQFPPLSQAESAAVEQAISCAKRDLAANYALVPGEQVVSEFFSYLSEPFEDIPAGTAVLRQETNFAVTYFFFDNTKVEGTRVVFVQPGPVTAELAAGAPVVGGPLVSFALSLARALLTGIASSTGKEIGALICNEIFQALDLDYFQPTEAMLKKIIHTEVTQTVISQINGRINGTKNWIRSTYTPLKAQYTSSPSDGLRQQMQWNLSSYSNDMFTEAMGPLMEDQFAQPGFAVFLIGGGVHLSLNQELALLDKTVATPSESAYAKAVSSLADQYATFGQTTYNAISQSRKAMIYMKLGKTCSSAGGYPVCSEHYYWNDDYTGEHHEYSPDKNETIDDAKAECQAAMNQHVQQALAQLNTDLGDPNGTISAWRNLMTQPVPLVQSVLTGAGEKAALPA